MIDPTNEVMSMRLPAALRERLNLCAAVLETSVSSVARMAIEDGINARLDDPDFLERARKYFAAQSALLLSRGADQ